jgi:hypothetical protein
MQDVDLTRAAMALRNHFGETLDGGREEGMRLMADVLQETMGLAQAEAAETVRVLEQNRTIRWREPGGAAGTIAQATMPFAEALGAQNPAGAATSAEVPLQAGYWQLG